MLEKFTPEQWKEWNADNPTFNPEEFDFHQKRFRDQSEQYSHNIFLKAFRKIQHPLVSDSLRRKFIAENPEDLAAIDAAHEEALAEYEEREFRKEGKEYEKWMEMLRAVVTDLRLKRDQSESAEAKKIKVLKIIMGGGNRGSYSAGQEVAQHEMGFYPETTGKKHQVFDYILGISAGTATAAFTIGGKEQVLDGSSYYYQECTSKEFIQEKYFKGANPLKWIHLNLNWIIKRFENGDENGKKKLDVPGIHSSPIGYFVQVADKIDGSPSIVNAKTAKEGLLQAMKGSMAIPWLYDETVKVNDIERIDGGIEPCPIEQILKEFPDVTDIIIEPNIPLEEMDVFQFQDLKMQIILGLAQLGGTVSRDTSAILARKVRIQKRELRKALELITKQTGIKIAILWPPKLPVDTITTDSGTIKAATWDTARQTCKDFGEPEKAKNIILR